MNRRTFLVTLSALAAVLGVRRPAEAKTEQVTAWFWPQPKQVEMPHYIIKPESGTWVYRKRADGLYNWERVG